MTSRAFDQQIVDTLRWEGGYVLDRDDPGGETNFGISKRSYPSLNIAALTREEAVSIYWQDFWEPLKLDDLPELTAMKVFDLAVNTGQHQAVRLLQHALVDLGFPLKIDGALGPATRSAVRAAGDTAARRELIAHAREFYTQLADRHPHLRKYLNGWLARASS